MKRLMWFAVIALGLAACGGTSTTNPGPTTTATAAGQIAATDLSGINLEVHQAPG